MESLLGLFVHVDDFCQTFLPSLEQHLLNSGVAKGQRESVRAKHIVIYSTITWKAT